MLKEHQRVNEAPVGMSGSEVGLLASIALKVHLSLKTGFPAGGKLKGLQMTISAGAYGCVVQTGAPCILPAGLVFLVRELAPQLGCYGVFETKSKM